MVSTIFILEDSMKPTYTNNFSSISSDDTLFDFDVIISKIKRAKGLRDHHFADAIRAHFKRKYQSMTEVEQAVIVANFMMKEMDYKKFTETMDILDVKMEIKVDF